MSPHGFVVQSIPETFQWVAVSGPGTTTLTDATSLDCTASFSEPGEYVLEFRVDTGAGIVSDSVTILSQQL